MQQRHKTVYHYSCKICYTDGRKEPTKIDLPDGVDADKFAEILLKQNLSDVGVIHVMRTKSVYDLGMKKTKTNNIIYNKTNTLDMYVDDRVKTAADIKSFLVRKFNSVCGFNITPGQENISPVIITSMLTLNRCGIMANNPNVEQHWQEHRVNVATPQPKRDVIVNRNLKQIWPHAADNLPVRLRAFFIQNQKG